MSWRVKVVDIVVEKGAEKGKFFERDELIAPFILQKDSIMGSVGNNKKYIIII